MNVNSEGAADLIFEQTFHEKTEKLELDGEMLSVLMHFNGETKLGEVAKKLGFTLETLRPIVAKLVKQNLIKQHVTTIRSVDPEFMAFLLSKYCAAIGPLGKMFLEDALEELGYTHLNLPVQQVTELINLLSQDILREKKRITFKKLMLRRIYTFYQ